VETAYAEAPVDSEPLHGSLVLASYTVLDVVESPVETVNGSHKLEVA
jgi:hypothetical protein